VTAVVAVGLVIVSTVGAALIAVGVGDILGAPWRRR
jgi:hypothetical protein